MVTAPLRLPLPRRPHCTASSPVLRPTLATCATHPHPRRSRAKPAATLNPSPRPRGPSPCTPTRPYATRTPLHPPPVSAPAQVKNHGSRDSAFRLLPNPHVTVRPASGRIAADETLDLELVFLVPEPGVLATTLALEMRGGQVVRVPFRAEGVVPHVEVEQVRPLV